ncbi:hypothetical protein H0W80_01035 [Candidatus Saccharibacteria bacterium]|nr:hypothetical protein [Candidatus Saccharibacteria bacterium]
MKTLDRVEAILRAVPKTRNSDMELLIIYLQKSGMELTDKQIQIFKDAPAMETITRVRRKIQEQGKYPASAEVEEARYQKFKQVRSNISYSKNPEELLEARGYKVLPYGQ